MVFGCAGSIYAILANLVRNMWARSPGDALAVSPDELKKAKKSETPTVASQQPHAAMHLQFSIPNLIDFQHYFLGRSSVTEHFFCVIPAVKIGLCNLDSLMLGSQNKQVLVVCYSDCVLNVHFLWSSKWDRAQADFQFLVVITSFIPGIGVLLR